MSIIARGRHVARAEKDSAEFGKNKNGKDYLLIRFEVVGGEDDGRTIATRLYLTDAAIERNVEALRNCGCTFPDHDITNLDGLGSKDVELVVEHEERDGTTYANVKWINALSSGGVKKEDRVTGAALDALRDRARGVLAGSRGGATASQPVNTSDCPI